MHYVIKNTPDTPNSEGERVEYSAALARVNELSGRPIGPYVLAKLRDKPRVYVATALGSPGRRQYGQGFIMEKVP